MGSLCSARRKWSTRRRKRIFATTQCTLFTTRGIMCHACISQPQTMIFNPSRRRLFIRTSTRTTSTRLSRWKSSLSWTWACLQCILANMPKCLKRCPTPWWRVNRKCSLTSRCWSSWSSSQMWSQQSSSIWLATWSFNDWSQDSSLWNLSSPLLRWLPSQILGFPPVLLLVITE